MNLLLGFFSYVDGGKTKQNKKTTNTSKLLISGANSDEQIVLEKARSER